MNVIIHEHLTCYLLRWIIQMTVLICIWIFLDNFVGRPCDLSGYIVGYVCRNPLLVGRGYPQRITLKGNHHGISGDPYCLDPFQVASWCLWSICPKNLQRLSWVHHSFSWNPWWSCVVAWLQENILAGLIWKKPLMGKFGGWNVCFSRFLVKHALEYLGEA